MDLDWRAMPMQAAKDDKRPYLGAGVYMHVVETSGGESKPHYIGKAKNLGRRWREHVLDWYVYPHEGYFVAASAENYLADPIDAINNEQLAQCLPNRAETMRKILKHTWFCWAEIKAPARRVDVEYVLQEGAKLHLGIKANGWIGDVGKRRVPAEAHVINNHLARPILAGTLPDMITYDPENGVLIE